MTTYNVLRKIIPPDQALANEALSRSLRQVKQIFDTDLPTFAEAVSNLESNKDLNLINELSTPVPAVFANFINSSLGTGTGPGNTVTTNDVIGVAAGATIVDVIPNVTSGLNDLAESGALDVLTFDDGNPSSSSVLGIYTVMQYVIDGEYTQISIIVNPSPPPADITEYSVDIPSPQPGAGTYGPFSSLTAALDAAMGNLINIANAAINTIASNNPDIALQSNQAFDAMAEQLVLNVNNSTAAGIDIGNVVNDITNANLASNSVSSSLSLVTRLHDIGLDISVGGQAQFFEAVANVQNTPGQAVISSMREGRNIAVLGAVGIQLDTQLVDVNPNVTVANNLQDAQYSVSEARVKIIY